LFDAGAPDSFTPRLGEALPGGGFAIARQKKRFDFRNLPPPPGRGSSCGDAAFYQAFE
jgi:hypothetical protein